MTDIPHFDLPFRFANNVAVQVEQDSDKDILNCVNAACRTERDTRLYVPNFGIDDPTFSLQPLDLTRLLAQVRESEPRAELTATQITDMLEAQVTIGVGTIGE